MEGKGSLWWVASTPSTLHRDLLLVMEQSHGCSVSVAHPKDHPTSLPCVAAAPHVPHSPSSLHSQLARCHLRKCPAPPGKTNSTGGKIWSLTTSRQSADLVLLAHDVAGAQPHQQQPAHTTLPPQALTAALLLILVKGNLDSFDHMTFFFCSRVQPYCSLEK